MEREFQAPAALPAFTEDQIRLIKSQICVGATEDELAMFLYHAQRTGLDPLSRQIYAVFRKDKLSGRKKMSIQTSIDGFRLIAQRTGQYQGQVGPHWCGQDGIWVDVWTQGNPPAAARVGVWRVGFKEPTFATCHWAEYNQGTTMWGKLPTTMLAKCAEALALRRAFPQELSGVYTEDEMTPAPDPAVLHKASTQAKQLIGTIHQLMTQQGLTPLDLVHITGMDCWTDKKAVLKTSPTDLEAGLRLLQEYVDTHPIVDPCSNSFPTAPAAPSTDTPRPPASPFPSEPDQPSAEARALEEARHLAVAIMRPVSDGTLTLDEVKQIGGFDQLDPLAKAGAVDQLVEILHRVEAALAARTPSP